MFFLTLTKNKKNLLTVSGSMCYILLYKGVSKVHKIWKHLLILVENRQELLPIFLKKFANDF